MGIRSAAWLFLVLIVGVATATRHCWECRGEEECARAARNVSCEHAGFGCAKFLYGHEPFVEKGCLHSLVTGKMVKLTTCTRKQRNDDVTKRFWQCGCMGRDNCNGAASALLSYLPTGLISLSSIVSRFAS